MECLAHAVGNNAASILQTMGDGNDDEVPYKKSIRNKQQQTSNRKVKEKFGSLSACIALKKREQNAMNKKTVDQNHVCICLRSKRRKKKIIATKSIFM